MSGDNSPPILSSEKDPSDDNLDNENSDFSSSFLDKSEPERRELNFTEHSPLFIDNKKVYYEGFKALSEDDKARVLLGFLQESIGSPPLDNLDNLNPSTLREKHQITRDNIQFKLKLWGTGAVLGLLIIGGIIVLGLFTYMSLDKGLLDENGTFSGIMSTLQEVLRILFTDSNSSSF